MKTNRILKILTIFCFILSANSFNSLFAQDEEFENYSFDDGQEAEQSTPYFALSLGATGSFLFMDYADINSREIYSTLSFLDMPKMEFSGPIFCIGFDFFTAMSPLVNNVRVGVNYHSGSQEIDVNKMVSIPIIAESDIELNCFRKLSVSSGGLHFDYAFVPFKSLAVLPGLGLKYGTMTLEQYTTPINVPAGTNLGVQWDETVGKLYLFNNEKTEYSFFAVEPQINIEYAITGFMMLRVGCSYSLSFDNPFVDNAWTVNGNNAFTVVPSNIGPKGFQATVGLFLGLFNY